PADMEADDALVFVREILVRRRMVVRAHAEERVRERRQIAREDQRRDARRVGLEGERDDVAHQPEAIAKIRRPDVAIAIDARLDLAQGGEVAVESRSIGCADLSRETTRAIPDAIEDAARLAAKATIEQAIERARRIRVGGHRGVGPPGDLRAV